MGGAEGLFDAAQVDRRTGRRSAEGLAGDTTAKGMLLQVVEAGGALDVRHGLQRRGLHPLEYLSAGDRPFELPDELFEVVLHHPVEVHQLAVDVVEDFDLRRMGFEEEERCAAGKQLDVALMGWKQGDLQGDQLVRKAALAAHPRDDGFCHVRLLEERGSWPSDG